MTRVCLTTQAQIDTVADRLASILGGGGLTVPSAAGAKPGDKK